MAVTQVGYNAAGMPLDFMTAAAWFAASVTGDEGQFWYSNATTRNIWRENIAPPGGTTKCLSMTGRLSRRRVIFWASAAWYRMTGDLSGSLTQVTIQNLAVQAGAQGTTDYGIEWNDTSGLGAGLRVTNCDLRGFARSIRFAAGKPGSCQADYVSAFSGYSNGITAALGGCKFYNCTVVSCGFGFHSNVVAGGLPLVIVNCYAGANTNTDFGVGVGTVVPIITCCASSDGTADDWGGAGNLIDQHVDDMKFWGDNLNGHPIDEFRILQCSPLCRKGTNLGLPIDCDGNPVNPINPSIGWHEGTSSPFNIYPGRPKDYDIVGKELRVA